MRLGAITHSLLCQTLVAEFARRRLARMARIVRARIIGAIRTPMPSVRSLVPPVLGHLHHLLGLNLDRYAQWGKARSRAWLPTEVCDVGGDEFPTSTRYCLGDLGWLLPGRRLSPSSVGV